MIDLIYEKLNEAHQQVQAGKARPVHFVTAVERVDWKIAPPALFHQAIGQLLELEIIPLARQLADQGHAQYPDDDRLERLARVLAPPRIVDHRVTPRPSLEETMNWVREHSAKYSGHWVAVNSGQLVGHATTRQTLVDAVGELATQRDTFIVRLP